jgi:hypothetical protein
MGVNVCEWRRQNSGDRRQKGVEWNDWPGKVSVCLLPESIAHGFNRGRNKKGKTAPLHYFFLWKM